MLEVGKKRYDLGNGQFLAIVSTGNTIRLTVGNKPDGEEISVATVEVSVADDIGFSLFDVFRRIPPITRGEIPKSVIVF